MREVEDRDNEERHAARRDRDKRREERREEERRERREDNPLFFVGLTRTPAISRPIKSRRGLRLLSLFYLFSLYFTLIG